MLAYNILQGFEKGPPGQSSLAPEEGGSPSSVYADAACTVTHSYCTVHDMLGSHVAFPEGGWRDGNVQVEVAERLLDRLEDCKRAFPVVGVLGGAGGAVLQRLKCGRAGIERVLYLDSSRDMLAHVRQQQQVSLAELRWTSL